MRNEQLQSAFAAVSPIKASARLAKIIMKILWEEFSLAPEAYNFRFSRFNFSLPPRLHSVIYFAAKIAHQNPLSLRNVEGKGRSCKIVTVHTIRGRRFLAELLFKKVPTLAIDFSSSHQQHSLFHSCHSRFHELPIIERKARVTNASERGLIKKRAHLMSF